MLKKIFLLMFIFYISHAVEWVDDLNSMTKKTNKNTLITNDPTKGLILDHLSTDVLIGIWGYNNWNWGARSFHVKSEDWFEEDSATGGSDKTGHFYMTYLLSRILSSRMEDRGWSLEEASLAGSLSGMLAMTFLEIGDGTSSYGFSTEDLLADGLGALSAYFIRSNPKVDEFIDIRLEYLPSSGYLDNADTATDYSGMKHLVAFKLAGFDDIKETPLQYIEFQVGYYSRGYRTYDVDVAKSQQIYVGVGLNLAQLANKSGINILKNLFEFYQPGYTYLETNAWER